MSDYLHDKHFTLPEAHGLLKEIVPLIEEIVDLKRKLDDRGYDIYRHQYFGGSGPNGERVFPPELEHLVKAAKALENKGVILKSIEDGLIDFPFIRSNKEEVYLCWKTGEKGIGFWHAVEDGFAGRRPLQDL